MEESKFSNNVANANTLKIPAFNLQKEEERQESKMENFLHKHYYKILFFFILISLISLIFINGMAIYDRDLFISEYKKTR